MEQKALQTMFDKIPWEDLVDSFNNKLTHKQEIRFNFCFYLFSNSFETLNANTADKLNT